jgi:hypothetical protein
MFQRIHLQDLCDAIQNQVMTENKEKHGEKLFLNAIILRPIKALHCHYAELMEDNKAQELNHFKDAYKNCLQVHGKRL